MGVFHRQTQLEIVWDVSWTLYVGVCVLWVDVWTCGRVDVLACVLDCCGGRASLCMRW